MNSKMAVQGMGHWDLGLVEGWDEAELNLFEVKLNSTLQLVGVKSSYSHLKVVFYAD